MDTKAVGQVGLLSLLPFSTNYHTNAVSPFKYHLGVRKRERLRPQFNRNTVSPDKEIKKDTSVYCLSILLVTPNAECGTLYLMWLELYAWKYITVHCSLEDDPRCEVNFGFQTTSKLNFARGLLSLPHYKRWHGTIEGCVGESLVQSLTQ